MSNADIIEISTIIPMDQVQQYCSPESELITVDGKTVVYYNGQAICELGRKKALENAWVHPEPGYTVGRCKMIKVNGARCSNGVRPGWTVCRFHGAGGPDRPGGGEPGVGRWAPHLPQKLVADYQAFLEDPSTLSMHDEMALIDTRIANQIKRLDGFDSDEGWNKVRSAYMSLQRWYEANSTSDELQEVIDLLSTALDCKATDKEVWHDLTKLVDTRRKLADTERKHVESSKKYLTLQEANAMMAYMMNSVMEIVKDPLERRRIADSLRRFGPQEDQE